MHRFGLTATDPGGLIEGRARGAGVLTEGHFEGAALLIEGQGRGEVLHLAVMIEVLGRDEVLGPAVVLEPAADTDQRGMDQEKEVVSEHREPHGRLVFKQLKHGNCRMIRCRWI